LQRILEKYYQVIKQGIVH